MCDAMSEVSRACVDAEPAGDCRMLKLQIAELEEALKNKEVETDVLRSKVENLNDEKKQWALELANHYKKFVLQSAEGGANPEEPIEEALGASYAVGSKVVRGRVVVPDFISFGDVTHVFLDPSDKSKYETIPTDDLARFLEMHSVEVVADEEETMDADYQSTLDSALEALRDSVDGHRSAVEGRQAVETKLRGVKAKTAALFEGKLKGTELMLKSGLKQRDGEHKAKLVQMQRKYEAIVQKLKDEIARLRERIDKGENTVALRNGFASKEREFQKEIRELKDKIEFLQRELKASKQLVADNFAANSKQRQELKEARATLAEFEDTKSRLIAAEMSIHQHSEVRDVRAKCDEQLRVHQRMVLAEKERGHRLQQDLTRLREDLNRCVQAESDVRHAYRCLCAEFEERVGEAPEVRLEVGGNGVMDE